MRRDPTILLADGNIELCELLRDCLEGAGFQTSVATTPELALARLEHERIDLAVVDATISRRAGFAIEDLAAEKDIAVLMISGHPELIEHLKERRLRYLCKPFRLSTFLTTVQDLLLPRVGGPVHAAAPPRGRGGEDRPEAE